jgi:hypothetical protein
MTEVVIKEFVYALDENNELYYHAFMKEDGKVTAFSVMTDIKGK